ncbi:MAG: phage virion morphogenesis protein [Pseudomonadota bacterium]
MALIQIDVDDREVLDVLAKLARRAGDLSPALRQIGEDLADSTQRRFATGTAPDGSRWAPNSPTTLLRYLASKDRPKGVFGKRDGKLTARGIGVALGKKPLVDSGNLASTINYQVVDGGRTLLVGSPQKYAAVQQFGAKKGSLGKRAPWGDIPARPFLGISADDRRSILDVLQAYLLKP